MSITNRLARRMAQIVLFAALGLIALDALPFAEVASANVLGLIGLIPALLGLPTWRNIAEARSDPEAYFAEHQFGEPGGQ